MYGINNVGYVIKTSDQVFIKGEDTKSESCIIEIFSKVTQNTLHTIWTSWHMCFKDSSRYVSIAIRCLIEKRFFDKIEML